jgi:diguanylate cyclase (GGDEF)-like protein
MTKVFSVRAQTTATHTLWSILPLRALVQFPFIHHVSFVFNFLILLCFSAGPVLAKQNNSRLNQLGAPLISNFDAKLYKAHSQNWAALQDKRGLLYFGNSQGILEFDGQHWRSLPTTGNPMVRSLAMAKDGTIFYGAIGDFGYLEANKQGKLSAKSIKDMLPEEERVFNDVWQIETTSQGVYFLTRSRIFRLHQGKLSSLAGKFASSQAVVINDTIFYVDSERGISRIEGNEVHPIPQLVSLLNGRRIVLTQSGPHKLLAGRTKGDFKEIDLSPLWNQNKNRYVNQESATLAISDFPSELDGLLDEDHAYLYKLITLDDHRFAISTVRAGILIFDRQGKMLQAINKKAGLQDNTVAGIMLDRDNNLWAATNSGISYIELSAPQTVFGAKHGLEGISISAAYFQGRLYLGGFQNIYVKAPFQYDLKNDTPQFHPLKIGTSEVWQFLEVAGDLLAASGRGLYKISGETATKIERSSGNAYCLGFSAAWPDHVFVGLMGGVEVFKKQGGQWQLQGRLQGVKENIRRISTDVNGGLWLNTEVGGLLRVHFKNSSVTDIETHRLGKSHGIPDLIASRTSSVGGELFLSTPKGLYVAEIAPWQASKDETRFVPEPRFGKQFADGSMEVSEIVSDGARGYLLKTTNGIFHVAQATQGRWQVRADAFRGLPMPDDTLFVHPEGGVWLTGESLYRVDLNARSHPSKAYSALISSVRSKGKQLIFEGTHARQGEFFGTALTAAELAQDPMLIPELNYEQNELVFEFSSSFFAKPGSTKFQYRLQGFDHDWSALDHATLKEYTNLPEGLYQFRVRAENVYGQQSDEAVYAFRILAPWYRTWWAYLMWASLAIISMIGAVYIYTWRLRKEKQHLEDLVDERTRQLRDASLTDPLTGLRNRRFISEVLHNDVAAFVGYKNYVISTESAREGMTGKEVFGLFLMDMDHFKHVNDTYGHDAGDQVLKQFADILNNLVRKDDVVIRLGGEEFLVVLKKTKPSYVHVFAKKVLEAVASKEFDLGEGTLLHKTCSVGYASFPVYQKSPDLLSFEQCMMIADMAMYHAKREGRNRAVYLCEGGCCPSNEQEIRKMTSSIEYALKEDFLRIGAVQLN